MNRRELLRAAGLGAAAAFLPSKSFAATPPAPDSRSETDLKITSVRLVRTRPKRPVPEVVG